MFIYPLLVFHQLTLFFIALELKKYKKLHNKSTKQKTYKYE